ncbi:MAG TPA: hypothetical protein VGN57_17110 [Pirellulaceae bacterium]|jgi:hypothetical protein|nr:hypothetical protein [Pirellulaceae bacterium]
MPEFSRSDLQAAFEDYARRVDDAARGARESVVEWRYADDAWPYGLHPLFAEAEMWSGKWKPRKFKWGAKESLEYWYALGTDADGRVQAVEAHNGSVMSFVRTGDVIDELFHSESKLYGLRRAVLTDGVVAAIYDYRDERDGEFSVDRFEYADGRCVRSIAQSEYVSDGAWKTSPRQTICDFEHDDQGLLRAYRDTGSGLGGRELVFQRPAGKSKAKKIERRPLVAYVVDADSSDEGPEYSVYCDVYGLEMTYDDDWPLDVVPFIPTEHVSIIFDSTNVTNDGTVYAGVVPGAGKVEFKAVAETGAVWVLLDAADSETKERIGTAWTAGLGICVIVDSAEQLLQAIGDAEPPAADRLAVALRTPRPVAASGARTQIKKVRDSLAAIGCAASRMVIAGSSLKSELEDYLAKADVDGVFLQEGGFAAAVEAGEEISLRRSAG